MMPGQARGAAGDTRPRGGERVRLKYRDVRRRHRFLFVFPIAATRFVFKMGFAIHVCFFAILRSPFGSHFVERFSGPLLCHPQLQGIF